MVSYVNSVVCEAPGRVLSSLSYVPGVRSQPQPPASSVLEAEVRRVRVRVRARTRARTSLPC